MWLPANTWSSRHESRGEDTSVSSGTALTGGAANVKGSWTSLGAVTSFAYEGFTFCVLSTTADESIIDIAVGAASSEAILVHDLHLAVNITAEHNQALYIPVHVPAGSQIRARVANTGTGAASVRVVLIGHEKNPGGFPGFSRAVALFTPGTSRGVTIDPGAVANKKGAWTQLTATSADEIQALFGVIGFAGDIGRAAAGIMLLDVGVGASGFETVVIPNIALNWSSVWDGPIDVFFQPMQKKVAAGSRIVARAQCSHATAGDRTVDLSLYGLV